MYANSHGATLPPPPGAADSIARHPAQNQRQISRKTGLFSPYVN